MCLDLWLDDSLDAGVGRGMLVGGGAMVAVLGVAGVIEGLRGLCRMMGGAGAVGVRGVFDECSGGAVVAGACTVFHGRSFLPLILFWYVVEVSGSE